MLRGLLVATLGIDADGCKHPLGLVEKCDRGPGAD